jgi:pentatricopeptide repeat protein
MARPFLLEGLDNWEDESVRERCAQRLETIASAYHLQPLAFHALLLKSGYTNELFRDGWEAFGHNLVMCSRKTDSRFVRMTFELFVLATKPGRVNPADLVSILARNWKALSPYFEFGKPHKNLDTLSDGERKRLTFRLMQCIDTLEPSPSIWAENCLKFSETEELLGKMVGIVAYSLCRLSSPSDALYVWRQYPRISARFAYHVANLLIVKGSPTEAEEALDLLKRSDVPPEKVEVLLSRWSQRSFGPIGAILRSPRSDSNLLLQDAAALVDNGAPDGIWHIIDEEMGPEGLRRQGPALSAALLRAHIKINDIRGAWQAFRKLQGRGLPMDVRAFNALLQGCIQNERLEGAIKVVDRMAEAGSVANVATYAKLVHLYGVRKDPDSAMEIFGMMQARGIEPDRIAYNSLMNVFVEVGMWDDAIRVYRFLERHPNFSLRPDVTSMNILLKAYVVLGAPLSDIVDVYRELIKRGEVTARTYALMLQACANARAMDIAEEVFAYLDRHDSPIKAEEYHFSIMIHGFLRLMRNRDAADYYNEMLRRGLQPTSITGSILVNAFAKVLTQEGVAEAEGVAMKMKDTVQSASRPPLDWKKDKYTAMGKEVEIIYAPLVTAAVRLIDPELANRYLKDITRNQLSLSMALTTSVLDLHRRTGDLEALYSLWDSIFEDVMEKAGDGQGKVRRGQNNILCFPLSIMIKALSTAGYLGDVVRLWADLSSRGFGFNSDNWNHLATAFLKGGNVLRGFWIIEHVLLLSEKAPDVAASPSDADAETSPERPPAPEEDSYDDEEVKDPGLDTSELVDANKRASNRALRHDVDDEQAALAKFPFDVQPGIKRDSGSLAGRQMDLSRALRETRLKKGLKLWKVYNTTLDAAQEVLDRMSRVKRAQILVDHPKTADKLVIHRDKALMRREWRGEFSFQQQQ